MLGWYFFNKITIGLNNGLNTASEPGASTPDHVSILSGEYLRDGGHQAGLNAIGISIGVSLKFATKKIAHHLKICDQVIKRPDDP